MLRILHTNSGLLTATCRGRGINIQIRPRRPATNDAGTGTTLSDGRMDKRMFTT